MSRLAPLVPLLKKLCIAKGIACDDDMDDAGAMDDDIKRDADGRFAKAAGAAAASSSAEAKKHAGLAKAATETRTKGLHTMAAAHHDMAAGSYRESAHHFTKGNMEAGHKATNEGRKHAARAQHFAAKPA